MITENEEYLTAQIRQAERETRNLQHDLDAAYAEIAALNTRNAEIAALNTRIKQRRQGTTTRANGRSPSG